MGDTYMVYQKNDKTVLQRCITASYKAKIENLP